MEFEGYHLLCCSRFAGVYTEDSQAAMMTQRNVKQLIPCNKNTMLIIGGAHLVIFGCILRLELQHLIDLLFSQPQVN